MAQNEILSIIADKETGEDELLLAIRMLDEVNVSSDFWVSIANDASYRKPHRAYCIYQLFQRHVAIGIKLSEFGRLLGNPRWLKDEDIEVFNVLRGKIPVKWTFEDTVFVLRIFPELPKGYGFAIYLRISGKIGRSDFTKVLRCQPVGQEIKDLVILEVGYHKSFNSTDRV